MYYVFWEDAYKTWHIACETEDIELAKFYWVEYRRKSDNVKILKDMRSRILVDDEA